MVPRVLQTRTAPPLGVLEQQLPEQLVRLRPASQRSTPTVCRLAPVFLRARIQKESTNESVL